MSHNRMYYVDVYERLGWDLVTFVVATGSGHSDGGGTILTPPIVLPEGHTLADSGSLLALGYIDSRLPEIGFLRAGAWQLGSSHGWVAWLEGEPADRSVLSLVNEQVRPV